MTFFKYSLNMQHAKKTVTRTNKNNSIAYMCKITFQMGKKRIQFIRNTTKRRKNRISLYLSRTVEILECRCVRAKLFFLTANDHLYNHLILAVAPCRLTTTTFRLIYSFIHLKLEVRGTFECCFEKRAGQNVEFCFWLFNF